MENHVPTDPARPNLGSDPQPKQKAKLFLWSAFTILLLLVVCGYMVISKKPEDTSKNTLAINSNSRTLEDLKKGYIAGHDAKNINSILKLYYLNGVDEETKDSLIKHNSEDFNYEIASVEIADPNPAWQYEYDFKGSHYKINLPVSNSMRINFKDSVTVKAHTTELLVGQKDGNYYIVTAAKTE